MVALESVNQVVGVVIAIIGTVVTAPDGTRDLLSGVRSRARRARVLLARALPFLRRDATVQLHAALGSVTANFQIEVSGSGWRWEPEAPLDERIEALRAHVADIESKLGDLRKSLSNEQRERAQAINDLRADLAAETSQLRNQLAERERIQARIDARGLPMIGLGIALCGIPQQIASVPWGLGWAAPTASIAITLSGLWGHYWERRDEREANSTT